MHTHPMKLLTVVAEADLERRLTDDLLALGAAGFSVVEGRGRGTRGLGGGGELPGANVRVEAVVPAPVAERILDRLAEHWFAHHSIVAYVADVAVVRPRKFAPPAPAPGASHVVP